MATGVIQVLLWLSFLFPFLESLYFALNPLDYDLAPKATIAVCMMYSLRLEQFVLAVDGHDGWIAKHIRSVSEGL